MEVIPNAIRVPPVTGNGPCYHGDDLDLSRPPNYAEVAAIYLQLLVSLLQARVWCFATHWLAIPLKDALLDEIQVSVG